MSSHPSTRTPTDLYVNTGDISSPSLRARLVSPPCTSSTMSSTIVDKQPPPTEDVISTSVNISKRAGSSFVKKYGAKLLEKVNTFRSISRQYIIGSSSSCDQEFLKSLKGCSTIEKRDNLMIPSSPVHRRPENLEENASQIFDNSLISPSGIRKKLNFGDLHTSPLLEATPVHLQSRGNNSDSAQKSQKAQDNSFSNSWFDDGFCQVQEELLGFSCLQLKTSLPIPPESIFLLDNDHPSISRLLSRKEVSHMKEASNGDDELVSQLQNMADRFDDKPGSRRSLTRKGSKRNASDVLEPDCIGLLVRSYFEGRIDQKDKRFISKFIFSSTPQSVQSHQLKAFALFSDFLSNTQSRSRKQDKLEEEIFIKQQDKFRKITQRKDLILGAVPPLVKVQPFVINCGCSFEQPGKVGVKVEDTIEIKNKTRNPISYFFYQPVTNPYYSLSITPMKGEIKKNGSLEVEISFTLHKPTTKVQELIILEIVGGARYYIGLDIPCEMKQFGVDPLDVEMEHVEGSNGTMPKVLVHLKGLLQKYRAFETEGLFRLAGNDKIIQKMKQELNRGEYIDHGPTSINEVANLIKIWFRELPENLFNATPPSKLESLDLDKEQHLILLDDLSDYRKRLLFWLLDLMIEVEQLKEVNKMNDTNLAIVFSPNLYNRQSKNPMASMIIASKMSGIVKAFINSRKKQLQL